MPFLCTLSNTMPRETNETNRNEMKWRKAEATEQTTKPINEIEIQATTEPIQSTRNNLHTQYAMVEFCAVCSMFCFGFILVGCWTVVAFESFVLLVGLAWPVRCCFSPIECVMQTHVWRRWNMKCAINNSLKLCACVSMWILTTCTKYLRPYIVHHSILHIYNAV